MSNRIQQRSRLTIMDGEVVTFAAGFQKPDPLWTYHEVIGPIHVSASRNAVIVHHAECRTREDVDLLMEAVKLAWAKYANLKEAT